jgi:GT2 family glycosyltransferase
MIKTEIWGINGATIKREILACGSVLAAVHLVYSKMTVNHLISIVITTYNRSEALVPVLQALSMQDDKDFEIVVADDGSTQAHQDAIKDASIRFGLKVTHVWHPDIGFTASCIRNRGVAATASSYIVLLDGDCIPEVDFVRQHKRLREANCFVNGSRVLLSQRLSELVITGMFSVVNRSCVDWFKMRLDKDASKLTGLIRLPNWCRRKSNTFRWKGIRSCNMALWRAHFLAIDGFDESFVGWGHEDADFVLRLQNFGIARKNGFCATEVFHLWHQASNREQESSNAQKVRDRMKSGSYLPKTGYSKSLMASGVVIQRLG